MKALNEVAKSLSPLLQPTAAAEAAEAEGDDGEGEGDEGEGETSTADPDLEKLVKFCGLQRKSLMADAMICGGCFATAKPECVAGTCKSCGFQALWQPVRRKLVDAYNKLRDGTPAVWQSKLRYGVLKSGGSEPSDGSATCV